MSEEKKNLREITHAYMRLLSTIDDPETDAVLADECWNEIREVDAEMSEKIAASIHIIRRMETAAETERARAARLLAYARARENDAERLRGWVSTCCDEAGITKIQAGDYAVTIAVGPPKVTIDASFLAWAAAERDDLLRYKEPEPDKKAIKRALEDGEVIPGAALVRTPQLRWR